VTWSVVIYLLADRVETGVAVRPLRNVVSVAVMV